MLAPGFLNHELPATRSIQPSPSKSPAPPDAAELKPVPTVLRTQWSGEQYSHQIIVALAFVEPLHATSRCPSAKSRSPSLSRSVSEVIEMQCARAGSSANMPIQWVLKGNFVSVGIAL